MKFLPEALKATLNRARFTKERTEIPNDHPAVASSLEHLKTIACILGLNVDQFNSTRYTFLVVTKPGDEPKIYSPYVGNHEGVAKLFWGDAKIPLTDLSAELAIVGEKIFTLEAFNADGDSVEIPLMLKRKDDEGNEIKYERSDVVKALRQKRLGDLLSASFEKPLKLKDVAPGTYNVIGYEVYLYKNEPQATMRLDGVGLVRANKALVRRLETEPVISKEQPAILEIGVSTKKTNAGFDIIPVKLTTQADFSIPVYDFGGGVDEHNLEFADAYDVAF